ncbi:MAG: outer membrane beta-barrel protein [Bacteroidaceae bacterium]|nr:outer membrane beta-barrel protein [Bacteroidaceae bacterium]
MIKRLFLSALLFFFALNVAQAQGISGRVINNVGTPVEGSNVVLQSADSVFVDVVLTDSAGLFSFGQNMDQFRLVVHHMAYHSRELVCVTSFVGDVVLEPQENLLQELEIVAERPLVKVENGALAYDLELLTRDKVANNAYEALTKLPGVSENEGSLTLVGANSLAVIINGKPSTMSAEQVASLLKSTPVGRVEKVEVMYSAPPQYHVRGAALNIVLKRETQYSLQGELGGDYINRFDNKGGAHAFLRAATPKFAFDAMYNVSRISEVQDLDMVSLHTFGGVQHNIQQLQEIRGGLWKHNARASFEYNFNEKNNISFAYNYQTKTDAESSSTSVGNYQNSEQKKVVDSDHMHNFSLQAFTGIGLSLGVDYTMYKNHSTQQMDVTYLSDSTRLFMSQNAGQDIRSLHAYADQKHSFPGGWTLGYGASYRNSESNDYQMFDAASTLVGTNVEAALSEHTAEAYVSFGRQSPLGLSFSLSATAEYYKVNERERWTFYPQASLTYMRHPDHIFQSTFNVNKLYPSYWQMQSAVSYIDGYSELHNSPGLEPSKSYMFNANYILKQKYVFGLFCNYIDKFFAQAMYQSTDRLALIYQTHNWDYFSQSGIMAVLPYAPAKWFNTRATLVGFYMAQRCDNFFDISFEDKKFAASASLNNSFRVNDDLAFELNGWVQSPITQGTFTVRTMWSLSAGAKWNFAGGKGTLSCFYNDIFNSTLGEMVMDYKGQNLVHKNNMYTRNFTISLVYRFGGYRKKEAKEVDTSRFGH